MEICICLYLFGDRFSLEFVFIYSISLMYKYLLELIKRRSKVQGKNTSCERPLNFDQLKRFCENYKPIRVWIWLVYKFTENDCHLWSFSEFIQTRKMYPTYLDKIIVLTWKLLVISSQNFPCELNLPMNLLTAKYLISVAAALRVGLLYNTKVTEDTVRHHEKFNNIFFSKVLCL